MQPSGGEDGIFRNPDSLTPEATLLSGNASQTRERGVARAGEMKEERELWHYQKRVLGRLVGSVT